MPRRATFRLLLWGVVSLQQGRRCAHFVGAVGWWPRGGINKPLRAGDAPGTRLEGRGLAAGRAALFYISRVTARARACAYLCFNSQPPVLLVELAMSDFFRLLAACTALKNPPNLSRALAYRSHNALDCARIVS